MLLSLINVFLSPFLIPFLSLKAMKKCLWVRIKKKKKKGVGSEADCLHLDSSSSNSSCVILGTLLNLSVPQVPHL